MNAPASASYSNCNRKRFSGIDLILNKYWTVNSHFVQLNAFGAHVKNNPLNRRTFDVPNLVLIISKISKKKLTFLIMSIKTNCECECECECIASYSVAVFVRRFDHIFSLLPTTFFPILS